MHYSSIITLFITAALALPTSEIVSKPKPKSFKLPLVRRIEGTVVSDDQGPIWVSTISVGGQELRVLIDTGSADL